MRIICRVRRRHNWLMGKAVGEFTPTPDICLTCGERTHWPPCPLAPHDSGLVYDSQQDVMVCPLCGHRQYEEMGG